MSDENQQTNGTVNSVESPEPKKRTAKRGRPAHSRIPGSALLPADHVGTPDGEVRRVKYWIGVVPECPLESVDIRGVHFPKVTAQVKPSSRAPGMTDRIPQIGVITELTEEKFLALRERIPRTVIRFIDGPPPTVGTRDLGDEAPRRRGHIITIPTPEELEERRRQGRSAREYRRQSGDVGVAKFLFMQLCKDQERGERGGTYPYTLDHSDMVWPYPLED